MTDNTKPNDLIALLRTFIGDTQIVRAAREAADVIEQQAARIAEFERILDGLPQDAIDGGWTARGISAYAKQLESRLAAPVADSAMAKDMALVRKSVLQDLIDDVEDYAASRTFRDHEAAWRRDLLTQARAAIAASAETGKK